MCASTSNHRPLLVYRHVVGTPVEDDVLVYEEKDIGFYVALSATQSAKFILIDAHDHQTSEVYLIDADAPLNGAARRRAAPTSATSISVEHHGDKLIITTNSDGAEDFRIVRGAGRRAGHGELARDHSAPARAA